MKYIAPVRSGVRSLAASCSARLSLGVASLCAASLGMTLSLGACTASPPVVGFSETITAHQAEPSFTLFTTDPILQQATLRARQRIENAIGVTGLTLTDADDAAACQPFQTGCGFELAFDELVYCRGDPEPALACTSQGVGGKTLGVKLQASLAGEELDNRLIHELLHVITSNRAPHSSNGLFMEYSFGDERITEGTLDSVCAHFSCSQFVVEEDAHSFVR